VALIGSFKIYGGEVSHHYQQILLSFFYAKVEIFCAKTQHRLENLVQNIIFLLPLFPFSKENHNFALQKYILLFIHI